MSGIGRAAALAAVVLLWWPGTAVHAQGKQAWDEYDRLLDRSRAITALSDDNAFGETVDLYTGTLAFSATDVSIPGNSKLPVAVTRKFTVSNRAEYGGPPGYMFGDWELDIPRLSGVFAPAWHDNRCDQAVPPPSNTAPADEFWAGNHADMPGGGEMLQATTTWPKPSTGGPYKWVTPGNTYFSCLASIANGTGQGFLAIGSDGTKYWFNHMARTYEPQFTYNSGGDYNPTITRYKVYLYATRVEDRFGNWVAYTYSNTATQGVKITQISANDGRTITFGYTGALVTSVSDGTRTWNYAYTGTSLSSVTLPDTSQWLISFAALANAQIDPAYDPNDGRTCFTLDSILAADYSGTITHPSGAVGTFTVGPVRFARTNVPALCRNWQPPGVADPAGTKDDYFVLPVRAWSLAPKSRQVSGPGLTTRTWAYSWSGGTGSWFYTANSGGQPVCKETTCLDPICVDDDCAGWRSLIIYEPDGSWTKHRYGNSYRYNEGKLLSTEIGTGSTVLRTVTYDHAYPNYPLSSAQPVWAKLGVSPQPRVAGFVSEYTRPMVARVTTQDATDFVWVVAKDCNGLYCFDAFARPTKVFKTSSAAGTTDLIPPSGKPTLTVPATSTTGSFTASWTTVPYAATYQLQERLGTSAWGTLQNTSATSRSLTGKVNGTWSYQVRACNAAGCAGWSTIETIEVMVPPSTAPAVTAPASSSTGNYSVTWTTSARATRYELDERKDSGAWVNIYNGSGTSRARSALTSGTYQYRARACNDGGCSAYSAAATTTVTITIPPPAAPSTLNAPATAEQSIPFTVSWSSVSGAASYRLERNRNNVGWGEAYDGTATSASESLGMAGSYQYRAQACNVNAVCGAYSPIKVVTVEASTDSVPTAAEGE